MLVYGAFVRSSKQGMMLEKRPAILRQDVRTRCAFNSVEDDRISTVESAMVAQGTLILIEHQ